MTFKGFPEPVKYVCTDCGHVMVTRAWRTRCGDCQSLNLNLLRGSVQTANTGVNE